MTSPEPPTSVHFVSTWSWLRNHPHDVREVNLTTAVPGDVTCGSCLELLPVDWASTHLSDGQGGPGCFPDQFSRQLASGVFGSVWGRHPFREALSTPGAVVVSGDLEAVDCTACLGSISYERSLNRISPCGCDKGRTGSRALGHRIHFRFPTGDPCGNYPTQTGPLRTSWDGVERDPRGRTSRANHEPATVADVTCLHCLNRLESARPIPFASELVA